MHAPLTQSLLCQPITAEWEHGAAQRDTFYAQREALVGVLATRTPSPEQVEQAVPLILSSVRRIPPRPVDQSQIEALCLQQQEAVDSGDASTYSRAFAGRVLYQTLPAITPLVPALLEPWVHRFVGAGMMLAALVAVDDDEASTAAAMRWCMDFAGQIQDLHNSGQLIDGSEGWRQWVHVLGFNALPMNFYSSRINLKAFAAFFAPFRREAFQRCPAPQQTGGLRVLGPIAPRSRLQKLRAMLPGSRKSRRIRIGFFTSNPHVHAHGLPDFIWPLAGLDRSLFEPVLIIHRYLERTRVIDDFLERHGAALQQCAPIIVVNSCDLEELVRYDLDLLYIYEGMGWGHTERPAHLRLAKHQITAFYTAATTGGTTLDHYLTAPALDPLGQLAFTEQPLLSDGLPFVFDEATYFRAMPTTGQRPAGIPEDAVIYALGAAMVNKIRPAFIAAMIAILQQVPNAVFIGMAFDTPAARQHLVASLIAHCQAAGVAPERIRFAPVSSRAELYSMLAGADVFLDYFPYTGTNNIIDPIAVHVPPLVCDDPGQFSRNRIGSVIMRQLGLEQLLARDEADFVAKAVQLGTDQQLRHTLRAQLGRDRLKHSVLFDGPAFVRRFEAAMLSLMPDAAAPDADLNRFAALGAAIDKSFETFTSNPTYGK